MRAPGDANGPERPTDWDRVDWRKARRLVRNLRQRIFRGSGLPEPCAGTTCTHGSEGREAQ
jgi:hypothetical protein